MSSWVIAVEITQILQETGNHYVDSLRMSHLAPSCWQSPLGSSTSPQFKDNGLYGSLTRYGALNSDFL